MGRSDREEWVRAGCGWLLEGGGVFGTSVFAGVICGEGGDDALSGEFASYELV